MNVYDEHNYKRIAIARIVYPKVSKQIPNDLPFAMQYFLTAKFSEWSYEKEWRIIAEIKSDKREMRYCPDSVKGVYIGHKVIDHAPNLYRLLLDIIEMKYPEIPIWVVYPHQTELRLNFEKVWPQ